MCPDVTAFLKIEISLRTPNHINTNIIPTPIILAKIPTNWAGVMLATSAVFNGSKVVAKSVAVFMINHPFLKNKVQKTIQLNFNNI